MTLMELKEQIVLGEDSRHQFKWDVANTDSLAAEMATFANCKGGTIFLGMADVQEKGTGYFCAKKSGMARGL